MELLRSCRGASAEAALQVDDDLVSEVLVKALTHRGAE
jgi:hypothetical protein